MAKLTGVGRQRAAQVLAVTDEGKIRDIITILQLLALPQFEHVEEIGLPGLAIGTPSLWLKTHDAFIIRSQ